MWYNGSMKREPKPWEPTKRERLFEPFGLGAAAEKLNQRLKQERIEYAKSIARGEQPNGAAAEYIQSEYLAESRS